MRGKRRFYGWMDGGNAFRISLYPPDSPVRPSAVFETLAEVEELLARKRAEIVWSPPLPDHLVTNAAR